MEGDAEPSTQKTKIYRAGFVYIMTSGGTKEQLEAGIKELFQSAQRALLKKLDLTYRLNYVTDHSGKPVGHAYLWVKDVELFNVLIGRNSDGTERYELVPDPDWANTSDLSDFTDDTDIEPELDEIQWLDESVGPVFAGFIDKDGNVLSREPSPMESTPPGSKRTSPMSCDVFEPISPPPAKKIKDSKSWADIVEEEEEALGLSPISRKNSPAPMIRRQLPPLISGARFRLTEQQRQERKEKFPEEEVPREAEFVFLPAFVTELEGEYLPHTLCVSRVPNWITEDQIQKVFLPYRSNPNAYSFFKEHHGKKYPFVVRKGPGIYLIHFDPNTSDAQFALLMQRKTTMSHGKNKIALKFNHARRMN